MCVIHQMYHYLEGNVYENIDSPNLSETRWFSTTNIRCACNSCNTNWIIMITADHGIYARALDRAQPVRTQ